MTTYRCQCGEIHDNTDGHRCMVVYDPATREARFVPVRAVYMTDDDVAYWARFAERRQEGWGPAQAAAIDACVELSARRISDLTDKDIAALRRLASELRAWTEVRDHFVHNHSAALEAIDKLVNARVSKERS